MNCCALHQPRFGALNHNNFFNALFTALPFARRNDCVNATAGERCEQLVLPNTAATRSPPFPHL
jgi:hypothetical protein